MGSSYYEVTAKEERARGHDDTPVPSRGPADIQGRVDDGSLGHFEYLYSSLVSDALDDLGMRSQVLSPGLIPFHRDTDTPLVGYAYPVLVRHTNEWVEIDRLLDMVERVPAGCVAIVTTDGDVDAALWGGLVSAGAQARGCRGAVVDGPVRDVHQIRQLGFAVFAVETCPRDIRGRGFVDTIDEPIVCRGVTVNPRDVVFADANGVVIVPADLVMAVRAECAERLGRELLTQDKLVAGVPIKDVYAELGAI